MLKIFLPLALVEGTIRESAFSIARFFSIYYASFIFCSIGGHISPFTMSYIAAPFSIVDGTIRESAFSIARFFSFYEASFIFFSIRIEESPLPMPTTFFPFALVSDLAKHVGDLFAPFTE